MIGLLMSVLASAAVGLPAGRAGRPDSVAVEWASVLRFGAAVAVAGDEVFIGRPGAAVRADSPMGGVYLFRRHAERWEEAAVLAPQGLRVDDEFGAVLAADEGVVAIGAPGTDGGRGAVYLFQRGTDGRWVFGARLVPTTPAPGERFGAAVALRAGMLLVGAPTAARDRGRVLLFRRDAAGRWTERQALTAKDAAQLGFGRAVALAAGRAFVTAPGRQKIWKYDPGEVGAAPRRVFVYRDSAGGLVPDTELAAPADTAAAQTGDEEGGDDFGAVLLADGMDLWASSPNTSAVFHFRRDAAGRWGGGTRLAPPRTNYAQAFGAALAHVGRELLVGAPGDNDSLEMQKANGPGAVYVFRYDSAAATWASAQRITPAKGTAPLPRYQNQSRFGETLAAGADWAVAGLPTADDYEGAVALLHREGGGGEWRQTAMVIDSGWTTRQPWTGRAVECVNGRALVFDCGHADLLAYLPLTAIGAAERVEAWPGMMVNSVWGWTDSASGREFALVGRMNGTAFVEVTDPVHPTYLGELPGHVGAKGTEWRDMKVYQHYAFVVAGGIAGPHGIQVFDLAQLLHVAAPTPVVFQETAHYDRVASVHTLAENNGFLYGASPDGGGETCGGGLHMVDVHTPTAPVFAGCYAEGYVHEAQCVDYHGPDQRYRGREICVTANAGNKTISIVDVTDKTHPLKIGGADYPTAEFAHQGWFTEDQRYFFFNDEGDEGTFASQYGLAEGRPRTIIFDLAKLDDPVVAKEFFGTVPAIDHNLYIKGHYVYEANYTAGLRVLDIADPVNPKEVAYFDTAPSSSLLQFRGAWTNYPFFKNGVVAVTSINEGLFLVRAPVGVSAAP